MIEAGTGRFLTTIFEQVVSLESRCEVLTRCVGGSITSIKFVVVKRILTQQHWEL